MKMILHIKKSYTAMIK